MTAAAWKRRIKAATKEAGTYRDFFESVIDTLSDILSKRDDAQALFIATGGNMIVSHTNKAGATNLEQNPILRLINEYNRDALAYWRDLGLTPAGYKKLNADVVEKEGGKTLEDILEAITTK